MDFRPGPRRPHTPAPLWPAAAGYVGLLAAAALILWALRG